MNQAICFLSVLSLAVGTFTSQVLASEAHFDVHQDIDTIALRANHAPKWLDIRLPESVWRDGDTNAQGLQLDQWELIHPSVVYFPDGFMGYKYWLAGTPYNQGPLDEYPCIYVSNDNATWSEVVVEGDTLHNPLFTPDDFDVLYLSDCDLFLSHDGELWLVFRGKIQNLSYADTNFVFGVYTQDGIAWHGKNESQSPANIADTLIGPVTGSDCLSHHAGDLRSAQGFDLLSPSILVDSNGVHYMWTVETGNYLPVCGTGDTEFVSRRNFVTLWQASEPEGPWDTIQTCYWLPTDTLMRDIWHLSVLRYTGGALLSLVTEVPIGSTGSMSWLHPAISHDGGLTFTTRQFQLISAKSCPHWADQQVYRSCGMLKWTATDTVVGVYYSALGGRGDDTLDNQARWAIGYTECFKDAPCLNRGNTDGISDFGGPINVADLSFLVDYLFLCGDAPPSLEEANVDSDCTFGCINVVDLSYLVDYLFNDGPPPGPCP